MNIENIWSERVAPFRIFGNLYFVGTFSASTHLLDTGAGLIIIDSGYPQTLYLTLQSIYELGFDAKDIKYIVHSHGHYDHLGATRALVELFHCRTFLGEEDVPFATGEIDRTWASELGFKFYETFTPDVALQDNSVISLGKTAIHCVATPGHTPGCMSFFFDISDGKETFRAAMHGGVGMNSMSRQEFEKYGVSADIRDEFRKGLDRLRKEKVEIVLGNHAGNNDTFDKGELIKTGKAKNPFYAPQEWIPFLDQCEKNLNKLIAKEALS